MTTDTSRAISDAYASAPSPGVHTLRSDKRNSGLKAYFQPIGSLQSASIMGHQVLLADDLGKRFVRPEGIGSHRGSIHRKTRLDWRVATLAYRLGVCHGDKGCLFLNLSADLVLRAAMQFGMSAIVEWMRGEGDDSGQLVVNLGGYDDLSMLDGLATVKAAMREQGVQLSLSLPADGRPSLLAWEKLRPDYAWLGRYSIQGVDSHPHKRVTVRAIRRISAEMNVQLIAGGICRPTEAVALRDLGVEFGQGRLLGQPLTKPVNKLLPVAVDSLCMA